jgi:hypothetical protein
MTTVFTEHASNAAALLLHKEIFQKEIANLIVIREPDQVSSGAVEENVFRSRWATHMKSDELCTRDSRFRSCSSSEYPPSSAFAIRPTRPIRLPEWSKTGEPEMRA